MTELDRDACYRALAARDVRFDGRIFVAVRTTGIYCRPICPARTPKLENVVFYPSAAAAQEAGFRPCLRCRPESSPDVAAWRGTSNTVSRALLLIGEGALDGDEAHVDDLAARLGVGERQLRRLFQKHLGTSPIAVAQTRRVLFAKKLIHETSMSMVQIANAAGFGSLRRYNEVFRRLYDRPPSELRRRARVTPSEAQGEITLMQSYVPPYDWPAMLQFFLARAIPGVEVVTDESYSRTIELDGSRGTLEVSAVPQKNALAVKIRFPVVEALPAIVTRVRRMFDLDADVLAIHRTLRRDPLLARCVARRPGLRVPGAWDGFELAVRALLGQQITVVAARGLAGRLVERYGHPFDMEALDGLRRTFPGPSTVASADIASLGMPRARAMSLIGLAEAARSDPALFDPSRPLEKTMDSLLALSGVGDWTAQYIAMRALRDPDALPSTDLGLLRGAAIDGRRPKPAELLERGELWRPWRAYAAQHLWTSDAEPRAVASTTRPVPVVSVSLGAP